ncbi:hypothetical protein F7731_23860 [Cytobacillus depressus]|uniref:Uncharacterized protein n=1 Tax=Cytobacillus depressus TaxID=1602942 RepID=A0A6L3V4N3_9BACI|nr:hypothetical protein [Cytobacillus depressus]KAB2328989.1 hypothetical protein F7731_23860 [Cytobacillus depressus]
MKIPIVKHSHDQANKLLELGLIGGAEVSRILGVDSKDVSRMANKGYIPEPLGSISGRSVWCRSVILAHLKSIEFLKFIEDEGLEAKFENWLPQ